MTEWLVLLIVLLAIGDVALGVGWYDEYQDRVALEQKLAGLERQVATVAMPLPEELRPVVEAWATVAEREHVWDPPGPDQARPVGGLVTLRLMDADEQVVVHTMTCPPRRRLPVVTWDDRRFAAAGFDADAGAWVYRQETA